MRARVDDVPCPPATGADVCVVAGCCGVRTLPFVMAAAGISFSWFRDSGSSAFTSMTAGSRSGTLDPKYVKIGEVLVIGE